MERNLTAVGGLVTLQQALRILAAAGTPVSYYRLYRYVRKQGVPVWRCGATMLVSVDALDGFPATKQAGVAVEDSDAA